MVYLRGPNGSGVLRLLISRLAISRPSLLARRSGRLELEVLSLSLTAFLKPNGVKIRTVKRGTNLPA